MFWRLPPRVKPLLFAAALLVLATYCLYFQKSVLEWTKTRDPPQRDQQSEQLPCARLPGVDNIVVMMRTGATEIQDKLPVHFSTTFRCYQDTLIFSDYAETFLGHPVYDAFANMKSDWKERSPDFDFYRRLQLHGREGLRPDELSGTASFEGSKEGKQSNAGWRLDKWKFLPMMVETLRLRPEKKWFVFVESDSYVVWSNLLPWLHKLDSEKALYAGSESQIGDDVFAHGGSVFVMTKAAIEKAVEVYKENEGKWHERTANHWAGDCILGNVLGEAGVRLSWSYPMFQGGNPQQMDFGETKPQAQRLWCTPALSYHHLSPAEMQQMWNFEQLWIEIQHNQASSWSRWSLWKGMRGVLEHRHIFKSLVWPNMTTDRSEWNNLSPHLSITAGDVTLEACRSHCQETEDCLQFSVGPNGCAVSTKEVIFGQRWKDMRSGWMKDRIEKWMRDLDHCKDSEKWILPH